MKNLCLFFPLFMFSACAYSQSLVISAGLEKNVEQTESQFTIGYKTAREWSFGTFIQSTLNIPTFEKPVSEDEHRWFGIYTSVPLVNSEKITFSAQLRSGLMDDMFIVVVPSLETKLKIAKWASISVGSSYRHGYPAFMCKLHCTIFKHI